MRLTVTNDDSEVVDSWDLDDWDLTKSLAKSALIDEVAKAYAFCLINRVPSVEGKEDLAEKLKDLVYGGGTE